MKILTLIEKEIKLAGNYFWLSIMVLIGIPIFLNQQSGGQYSGIYTLMIALNFSIYFLFNNINGIGKCFISFHFISNLLHAVFYG